MFRRLIDLIMLLIIVVPVLFWKHKGEDSE